MIRMCACPAVVHVVAVVATAAVVCQLILALVYSYHMLLLLLSAFLLLQLQLSDFVAVDAGLAVAAAVDSSAVFTDLAEAVPAVY